MDNESWIMDIDWSLVITVMDTWVYHRIDHQWVAYSHQEICSISSTISVSEREGLEYLFTFDASVCICLNLSMIILSFEYLFTIHGKLRNFHIYIVALFVSIPIMFSICRFKPKLLLGLGIILVICNLYWIIAVSTYSINEILPFVMPILCLGIPLNIMVLLLYWKLRKVEPGSERFSIRLDSGQNPNYNAIEIEESNNRRNNEVYQWLNSIELSQYYDTFIRNGIDNIDTILTLTKNDLIDIGVSKLGHRNRIIKKIRGGQDIDMELLDNEQGEIETNYI